MLECELPTYSAQLRLYCSLWGNSLIDGGSVFGSVMRVENRPGATAERLATLPGVLEDVGRG